MLVTGKDAYQDWFSATCCFRKRVGCFIEAPWDVTELKAIEFVLQPSDFLAVRSHLGIVAARLLHDLVDDQLGVVPDVEVSNAQLNGDA